MSDFNEKGGVSLGGEVIIEKVVAKSLPVEVGEGSVVVYHDTVASNPESFEFYAMKEIADSYGLDPVTDYERIRQLTRDPEIMNVVKVRLETKSIKAVEVIREDVPRGEREEMQERRSHGGFFDRFSYLPNSGQVEVSKEELEGVESFYVGGGITSEAYRGLLERGVYGDTGENPTYITTDYEVALSHSDDTGEAPVLIEVSKERLMERRTIYRDPESLSIKRESGRTFIVFEGISKGAIKKILILGEAGGSREDQGEE